MAQKVKPVRGADADSVARTVHGPVNGDLNTCPKSLDEWKVFPGERQVVPAPLRTPTIGANSDGAIVIQETARWITIDGK
ncbi:hypothetical protein DBV15_00003 [Temnothorax longispinosus]|uniref:Uncharacterized protein n=1 Tax=Temnothorax longispinosus TaxID=300112 RepID=A0A4V3SA33_9HYME|nr:hypothetical protein DBV15_00003 [Temnothorax longispinosus]